MWSGYVYFYDQDIAIAPTPGDLSLEAASRLAEAIREGDFNLAVAGAEIGDTVDTVVNSVRAVNDMFIGTLTGNWPRVMRGLGRVFGQSNLPSNKAWRRALRSGDISGAWLSLRYGWQPTIQDIYAAMKFIEQKCKGPRSLTYRGSSSRTVEISGAYFPHAVGAVAKVTRRFRVGYICTLQEPPSTARQLGLLDPLSVLWEKLPFSFVLDWMIPVGDYLGTCSQLIGLTNSYVKQDGLRETVAVAKPAVRCNRTWPESTVRGGGQSIEAVRFVRSVGTNLSVPKPSFKTWDRVFSLGHMQNAAALIHQIIDGSRRRV